MTTAVEVRAPAEQTEGTRSQVLRWLKNVGESVTENEPLIEIETDKVTVEVASPGSGILREIVKGEQEEIAPGEVLGRIESSDAGDVRAGAGAPPDVSQRGGDPMSSASVGDVGAGARIEQVSGFATGRLSPAVRRLLSENALDPAAIRGTGQGGRITVEDVLATIAAGRGTGALARSAGTPDSPPSDVTGGSHRIPHSA